MLDKKLQLLAEHAEFHVNINSVVGGGIRNPHDALVVGRRAVQLGFTSTIGIIHDGDGQLQPLATRSAKSSLKMKKLDEETLRALQLVPGQHRRTASPTTGDAAPARATSISARTGWCTTARSSAAIPARRCRNTRSTIFAASFCTEKGCAPHCTVSCVHQVSYMDFWRAPQHAATPQPPTSLGAGQLVQIE